MEDINKTVVNQEEEQELHSGDIHDQIKLIGKYTEEDAERYEWH